MTTVVRVLPTAEDGPTPRDAVVRAATLFYQARGRERTLAERVLRDAVRRLRATEAAHHNRRESP